MNCNQWHTLIMYPPKLSDDAVQAVWKYLNEVCQSFERHYAVQLKRKRDEKEGTPAEFRFDYEAENDPF